MAATFDKTAMMNQAQNIWTMLDEMASKDPASYKKFIDKHIKEGKEDLVPPKPHMCIQSTLKSVSKEKLYINFFGWKHIPSPKAPDDAVPVMGSPIHQESDSKAKYKIVSVAFNPKIIEEFGRNCKSAEDRDTLINLAMDYIEEVNKVTILRNYSILSKDDLYKGCLKYLQKSLRQTMGLEGKKFDETFEDVSKTFGPLAGASKGNLFEQLANISVDDNTNRSDNVSEHEPEIRLPDSRPAKPGLIQEINSIPVDKPCSLDVPEHTLEYSWNDNKDGQCTIKIVLPNVNSVSECELDISEDDLSLLVPEKYKFQIKFQNPVDDEEASARFLKKSHCLVIIMPLIKK